MCRNPIHHLRTYQDPDASGLGKSLMEHNGTMLPMIVFSFFDATNVYVHVYVYVYVYALQCNVM